MNRTVWTRYVLAASLALNLGIVASLVIRASAPRAADLAEQSKQLNLPDYLELSANQRAQWQELEPAFLRELAANWQQIRQHRETLVRRIFAAAPDRKDIDAEQAAIASLQEAQQQRVITQLLAERSILGEKQRQRLMDLLLNRYSQESTEEELLHRQ